MSEFERIQELLPGYILGVLDAEDESRVSAFLADCRACSEELAAMRAVTDEMLLAAPAVVPPVGLRQRLAERLGPSLERSAGMSGPAAAADRAKRGPGWRRWFSRPVVQAALALFVVALLAVNLFLWQLQSRPGTRALIPDGMSAWPVIPTENGLGASGFMLMSNDGNQGALICDDLPVLPEGQAYQVWLAHDDENVLDSGGLFTVDGVGYGGTRLRPPRSLDYYTRLGVTIEPAEGSPAPTGAKVLGTDLR